MKWGVLISIFVVSVCVVLFQWPRIPPAQKKERAAFIGLTLIGWLLGSFLTLYPDTPGPGHWMDMLFKPLSEMLEKGREAVIKD